MSPSKTNSIPVLYNSFYLPGWLNTTEMFKVLAIGWTIALLAGFGLAVPAPGSADKTCNRTAPQPPQQLQQQPAPFIYILNPQRYRFKYPSDLFKTRGEHLFSQYRNPAEKGDSIAHLVETDDPSVQVAQLIAPSDNIRKDHFTSFCLHLFTSVLINCCYVVC